MRKATFDNKNRRISEKKFGQIAQIETKNIPRKNNLNREKTNGKRCNRTKIALQVQLNYYQQSYFRKTFGQKF